MNVSHRHGLADCLTHVINGQQCDLHPCERFHLHSGLSRCLHCTDGPDRIIFFPHLKVYAAFVNQQHMAHRNQTAGLFRAHDACDPGHRKYISFFYLLRFDLLIDLFSDKDSALGRSFPSCILFVRHIHHHGVSVFIKM